MVRVATLVAGWLVPLAAAFAWLLTAGLLLFVVCLLYEMAVRLDRTRIARWWNAPSRELTLRTLLRQPAVMLGELLSAAAARMERILRLATARSV